MPYPKFQPPAEVHKPSELKRYNRTFPIYQHALFGAGTQVNIGEISVQPGVDGRSLVKASLTIVADVSFTAGQCSVCERETPPPDADSLWFVLENHDGSRLFVPDEHAAEDERDCWPVPGWSRADDDGALTCPECMADLAKAKKAIKARRKR